MYRVFMKRVFDLLLAITAIPFWFVLLLIIAPIIYIEDRGPVFYSSSRLGKNGKVFKMYKFRSMKVNAPDIRNEDGSTYNSEDDPRLTRIGRFIRKTSIDETPQLLNIIKGDMSFIGPRPDLPEHRELYNIDEIRKLMVRPGITGYNQAYFRNSVPWKERLRHDIFYVDNISFWFDIKILFKTFVSVVIHKDIYITSNNNANNNN